MSENKKCIFFLIRPVNICPSFPCSIPPSSSPIYNSERRKSLDQYAQVVARWEGFWRTIKVLMMHKKGSSNICWRPPPRKESGWGTKKNLLNLFLCYYCCWRMDSYSLHSSQKDYLQTEGFDVSKSHKSWKNFERD